MQADLLPILEWRPLPAGAYSSTYHPDWSILAARIAVSDLHKMTKDKFSENSQFLHDHLHPKVGGQAGLRGHTAITSFTECTHASPIPPAPLARLRPGCPRRSSPPT